MRVEGVILIVLALGAAPAAAADRAERVPRPSPAQRYYGPQLPLPGVAEQVIVERGPRILLEKDGIGVFAPVFATRRLPSRVRRVYVEADGPGYDGPVVETRSVRSWRRQGRSAPER